MPLDLAWIQTQFPLLSNFVPLNPTGQKEVFRASHPTEGQIVLKIFKPGSNPARTNRERAAPLTIGNNRIPLVLEEGRIQSPLGEVIWFREQRVAGESLKDLLASAKVFSPAEVVRIGLHVLEVLVAAERVRVVHRDIKPGNIIVRPDGSACVIDFGLARYLDLDSITPTAAHLSPHTPGYAPIEQFTNQKKDIDSRADLFALGVTLYESVTKNNPFINGARGPDEIRRRAATMSLPRLVLTPGMHPEFPDFIEAISRSRPQHRLQTAAAAYVWLHEIATAAGVA